MLLTFFVQLHNRGFLTGPARPVYIDSSNPEHVSGTGLQPPDFVAERVPVFDGRRPDLAPGQRVFDHVAGHYSTSVVGRAAPGHSGGGKGAGHRGFAAGRIWGAYTEKKESSFKNGQSVIEK